MKQKHFSWFLKCYHLEKNKNLKRNSKLPEGLAASLDEDVASNLRFYSLNVDECISNANQKVFSMIVSYFSESLQCVVVHHYNLKKFTVTLPIYLIMYKATQWRNSHSYLVNILSSSSLIFVRPCNGVHICDNILKKFVKSLIYPIRHQRIELSIAGYQHMMQL